MNLRALQQFANDILGAPQPTTKQFVAQWGFCPHFDMPRVGLGELCADCLTDPSQRSYHQSELLDLTHARQIAIFGWCPCEDNECSARQTENPYSDCPTQ